MFRLFKQRVRDMRTLSALCLGAERHANAEGHPEPGAEHFLLAALDLPDGTARRVFERVGAEPGAFRDAIAHQYRDALRTIGIDAPGFDGIGNEALPSPPGRKLYEVAASGQAVMQGMVAGRKAHKPLLGAHVVAVIVCIEQGIAARSLKKMGVDLDSLGAAAKAEIRAVGAH